MTHEPPGHSETSQDQEYRNYKFQTRLDNLGQAGQTHPVPADGRGSDRSDHRIPHERKGHQLNVGGKLWSVQQESRKRTGQREVENGEDSTHQPEEIDRIDSEPPGHFRFSD